MNKIWNKDNSIIIESTGEFMEPDDRLNPLGDEWENLIKFPGIADIFFRLHVMWGNHIDFVSDEPLSEGFKAYFSIDESFTDEIEVYDNAEKFIRKCNINDLYDTRKCFSQEFLESVNNKIIRVTTCKRHILRFIGSVRWKDDNRCINIIPIVWNPEEIDVIEKYYSHFDTKDMIDGEATIEVLDIPESFSIQTYEKGFEHMEIKISFDGAIPQLVELIESKMHELDIFAEIVNGFKRELEKNVTIRNISKTTIAGGCSIDFDINNDYFIGIWTNGLYRMNTVIVSLHEKYEFAGAAKSVIKGEIRVSCNPDEPFACDEAHFNVEDEFANELWPKVVSAVNAVIDRMNEKRS